MHNSPAEDPSNPSLWRNKVPVQTLIGERPYIYDCFLFHNELDVLEIRLATLYDTVDRFVLVEGTRTHSNQPKPLYFNDNKQRFGKYLDKISHIVVDDYPENPADAWVNERHQRDSIMRGLVECKDSDIIILGDADEIANPEVIAAYQPSQGLCRLKQRLFYHYLNNENTDGWDWLKIAPYRMVKELTPCGIRYPPSTAPIIDNAGWHFSFIGDAESAIAKVAAYAHTEYNTAELMDVGRVQRLIDSGADIFGRPITYSTVPIDPSYPPFIKDNLGVLASRGLIKATNVTFVPDVPFDLPKAAAATKAGLAALGKPTVTAEISTKDRYATTLGLCISAVLTQTHPPNKLVIYDDGEQADLREMEPFRGLLAMADARGIKWELFATPRQGQVVNHQHALDNATTDFVLRVDDDCVMMPDCLERLLESATDGVGAVGGLIHHPGEIQPPPDFLDGSLGDIDAGLNLAWYDWQGPPRETSHLYSSFIYRVDAARKAGGYPTTLSVVSHREESIFTHQLVRAGFKCIINPAAKMFHLRQPTGGIRSFNDTSLWEHDEQVWQSYRAEWGMAATNGHKSRLVVLDSGVGDHLLFKGIWNELVRRHPDTEYTLALCYPEVFDGIDAKVISIADAKLIVGDRYDEYSLYRYLWMRDWKGSLVDGMMEFYG